MACGLPCVLTRVPCYLDFGVAAEFAHFVAPRQPQEMAEGVCKLMTDTDYRRNIIEKGLEVARRHSLDHLGNRLAEFFAAVHEGKLSGKLFGVPAR